MFNLILLEFFLRIYLELEELIHEWSLRYLTIQQAVKIIEEVFNVLPNHGFLS